MKPVSLLIWPAAAITGCILTGLLRSYALAHQILDLPGHRSLHSNPTPRGGGISIVLASEACLVVAYLAHELSALIAIAIGAGTLLVAMIGWMDDRRPLTYQIRLSVQAMAALVALILLAAAHGPATRSITMTRLAIWNLLAGLGVIWATNLYNFMDGIDGLAATEGIIAGLAGAILIAQQSPGLAWVCLGVSGACAGFLVFNWQPAKIFMGDTGSGSLGFLFAILALASWNAGSARLIQWVIILGAFIFDATITLIRRVVARQAFHTAHRSHAYQRAVRSGWSHQRVTLVFGAISTVLGFCALAVGRWPQLDLLWYSVAILIVAVPYAWVELRLSFRSADLGQST